MMKLMLNHVIVRRAQFKDRENVLKIAKIALGVYHEYYVGKAFGHTKVLVIELNGDIIGFIQYYTIKLKAMRMCVIYYIAIKPEYQGKGFGSLLVNEIEREAYKSKVDLLIATTTRENTISQKFFRKHGFKVYPYEELENLIGVYGLFKLIRLLYAYEDDIVLLKELRKGSINMLFSELRKY